MAGRAGRNANPNLLSAPRNDDAGSGADRCGAWAQTDSPAVGAAKQFVNGPPGPGARASVADTVAGAGLDGLVWAGTGAP